MPEHKVYLPFVTSQPAQWEFTGSLRKVPGDTLDLSTLPTSNGAAVDMRLIESAIVRLGDGLSLLVAIIEDN